MICPSLTFIQKQCKESLVVLLYCHMTAADGFLPRDAFDFALPYAIGLAKAGRGVEYKTIGKYFRFLFLGAHLNTSVQAICSALKLCL